MKNIIYNNIIVEPSGELTPSIRISPFSNQNIYSRNNDEDKNVKEYFNNRFRYYTFTTKGRSAIALALSLLKLESNDVITILTTSNNFYISSMVKSVLGVIIYLIIFIPIYKLIGESMFVSISLMLIVYALMEFISLKILQSEELNINILPVIIIVLGMILFIILTFYPVHNFLFFDNIKFGYGILK